MSHKVKYPWGLISIHQLKFVYIPSQKGERKDWVFLETILKGKRSKAPTPRLVPSCVSLLTFQERQCEKYPAVLFCSVTYYIISVVIIHRSQSMNQRRNLLGGHKHENPLRIEDESTHNIRTITLLLQSCLTHRQCALGSSQRNECARTVLLCLTSSNLSISQ